MSFNWPEGNIETKFGEVRFARTQADHVSISTGQGDFIMVHGVYYHVHLHLYLREGAWVTNQGDRIYLQRDWGDKNANKGASLAAIKAATDELTRAWIEYAGQHPEQADEAERGKLERDIDSLTEDVAKLESELAEKRKELKGKQNTLKKLGGPLPA